MPTSMDPDAFKRYSRQLVLPEVGEAGQRKLQASSALIVGLGGLGSPVAQYLAAAGVGRLGLVDPDSVDLSNLHRQLLYTTSDVGARKTDAAAERIQSINPDASVETHAAKLTSANALKIIADYDVVVDATDNFPARYLINDACVLAGKPDVYGSVYRFEGHASVFWAQRGPCYRCLHPRPPAPGSVPNCEQAGVLGALPGIIGSIQAAESLKILLDVGQPLTGRLLIVDALDMEFVPIAVRKNPDCAVCSARPTVTGLIDYEAFCGLRPSEAPLPAAIDVRTLQEKRARREDVVVLDVRRPEEHDYAHIEGDVFIPMDQLERRLAELDPAREIVVYCHTGVRSLQVTNFLRRKGFARARNLTGGIAAWSREIDPTVPTY